MRQLQPVVWAKGTFLTPQHLQLQDRFVEDIFQFQLEALNFRPWGFREIRVDDEALAAGSFGITSASGIFPDGLLFDMPRSDPNPAPKALANCFDPDDDHLDLFLVVPNYRHNGLNLSTSQINVDARYRAEVTLLRDENSGLAEKPVQIARKNIRILTRGELRDGYSSLRIARVIRSAAGYRIDYQFVPPLLDIHASEYLVAIVRRLIEIMSARIGQLAGMRRQKNQSLAEFTSADIANFWLLHTMNSYLPLLNHLFAGVKTHPERLFSALLAFAGALTAFSSEIRPQDFPVYNHDDLGGVFHNMDDKVRALLETTVPTNVVSLPLTLVQPSIYATALAEDRFLVNTRMYLAISAEMNRANLIARAPQLIKLCSATHIETLIRQALPGIALTHAPVPASAIPVKLEYQYFSLNQSGMAWESVGRARNLAAYVPGDFPNPKLELLIILPQTSR